MSSLPASRCGEFKLLLSICAQFMPKKDLSKDANIFSQIKKPSESVINYLKIYIFKITSLCCFSHLKVKIDALYSHCKK